MKRLTDDEKDRIAIMREAGKTYGQIAQAIGCSASSASWHCLLLGADPPNARKLATKIVGPAAMKRGDHEVRRFTAEEDEIILKKEAEGASVTEIASAVGRRWNSTRARLMTLARRDERNMEGGHSK